MNKYSCFICLFIACAFAQEFVDLRSIDSFDKVTPLIVIDIPENPTFPLSFERSVSGTATDEIFGNARDLSLIVNSGNTDSSVSTGISNSDFTCTTPQFASAASILQYDGNDGTSVLDPGGLYDVNGLNNDLTLNGAFAFHAIIESDQPTTIDFRVFSGNAGDFCVTTVVIPGDDTLHDYFLNFNDFDLQGYGCDFTNVGAIEVEVDMFQNVDVLIQMISTWGPVPISPTPSRTPSPTSSPISPSPTSSPFIPSVTPRPSDTCSCFCPVFVCNVIRIDDGDYYFYNSFFANFFVRFFDPGYYVTFFTNYFVNPYYYTAFFQPTFFTPVFFDYYYFFTTPVFFDYYFFNFFFDLWYGLFSF